MKLVLISDLHILNHNPICRLDDLVTTQFNKLKFIFDYAVKNNISSILQAGDWWDSPRGYIILSKIMDLLNEYQAIDIYVVFGGKRHDTYLYSNETREATNLGVLGKSGIVWILGNTPTHIGEGGHVIDIYGASYGEDIPEIGGDGHFNILVIHSPITDNPKFNGEINANNFLSKYKDYDLILCGDIHRKFDFSTNKDLKRWIINTGPLLRKTVSEWEHKPCFAVFDTKSRDFKWVEIPHKPAEEVMNRDHIDIRNESSFLLDEFINSVRNEYEVTVDILENLQRWINDNRGQLNERVINRLAKRIGKDA